MLVETAPDDRRAYTLALHPDTLLADRYELVRVLAGSSAVALTYLGRDRKSQEQVVVKEFLPRTVAGRAADGLSVRPHSAEDAAAFARALRRFTREAELLADIVHPNIPRVRSTFAANGTAYIVFDHYDGKTAAEQVAASGGRLPVHRAVALAIEVLQGLQALHSEGVVHGHVTPENILVTAESRALLLGLGTTRQVVGGAKDPVPGFAPIEQYASKEVGPWTDVYACGAVLWMLATGAIPPSAIERSAGHMLMLPREGGIDVPATVARVMLSALAHLPDGRPHSADELRRRLEAALGGGQRDIVSRLEQHAQELWRAPASDAPEAEHRLPGAPLLLSEAQLLDEEAGLPTAGVGAGRFARFLRPDVGVAVAVVVILLSLLLASKRGEGGERAAGGVDAARPSPVVAEVASGVQALALARETDRASRPYGSALGQVTEGGAVQAQAAAELIRQQGGSAVPAGRATPTTDVAAQSPRQPAARPTANSASARPRADSARSGFAVGPRALSLKLPAGTAQPEMLPVEVVSDLRERLAHGKERADLGEYASARRIFLLALNHVTTLGDRYSGTRTLPSLKEELERAAEQVLAACVAENDLLRKRNGTPLKCE